MRAPSWATIVLAGTLLLGCGGDSGQVVPASLNEPPPPPPPPPPTVQVFPWVDGAWTQEVPAWGSPVRLSLPVPLEKLDLTDQAAIGGFGIHAGGHLEGLDHIWMHVQADAVVGSWADGTVTAIEDMGPAGDGLREYFVTIDYGQGLIGKHMEVQTPLVSVGQQVREGDPVAIGLPWRELRSAEFSLYDRNRANETGYGVTGAVSPFDYLKPGPKATLVERYVLEIADPHFRSGRSLGDSRIQEPFLTNRHILHPFHRGTPVGEWLLSNRGWMDPDPLYFDILTILDQHNPYGRFQVFGMMDENLFGPSAAQEGMWAMEGTEGIVFRGSRTFYGRFRVDESDVRARLLLEWREDGFPEAITEQAAIYVERAPIPRREDAWRLGRMP